MLTVVQTPAAGTDFDGTGILGLIDFTLALDDAGMSLPDDPGMVPIITSISLDNDAVETITVECFLKPAAAALTTTIRKTVRRPADPINGFNIDGCSIKVPRVIAGAPGVTAPWVLVLITTTKAATASFVCSFYIGSASGGSC